MPDGPGGHLRCRHRRFYALLSEADPTLEVRVAGAPTFVPLPHVEEALDGATDGPA